MSLLVPQNFYKETITRAVTLVGATNIYVSTLPTPAEGRLVISPSNTSLREIVRYTAKGTDGNGSYVTVTLVNRGLGGTTAQTHAIGEPVRMNVTAEDLQDISDAIDQIVAVGAQNASTTTKGITKLSTAPASATNPIAVGDNDPRILDQIAVTYGETLAVNDAVYLKVSDGKVYKTNADDISTLNFVGFAKTVGASGVIQTKGVVGGFTSLTVGGIYYLSGGTGTGTIITTAPTNGIIVGEAISATQILIDKRPSEIIRKYETPGTATWTKPSGLKWVEVEVQAGGGGANGSATPGTPTAGGTSSFGSHLQATGGGIDGQAGGVGSSGDFNSAGSSGGNGMPSGGRGGQGGSSMLGGGGAPQGGNASGYGGGGGGSQGSDSGHYGTNGGSGGGYSRKKISVTVLGTTETVTVGAKGNGAGSGYPGGDGAQGIVIVTEYY